MFNRRLLRPLDFLRIKVVEKRRYDFGYPFISGTAIVAFLFFGPFNIQVFGDKGIIDLIIRILQILTGFYIASLAAVATFNKDDMDKQMSGKPPELSVMRRGHRVIEKLTRRRFLSLMFGYLSFISIFLYFSGGLANLIAPHIAQYTSPILPWFKWVFIWCYMLLTCNLIVTTLLGLFYMCDRIHRE